MTKLIDRLPEGWAGIIAEEYSEGASDVEIRARLKITPALWDSLYNSPDESAFREVVDFGRMLSQAWWMRHGRTNLHNKQFNSSLWLMNMKNRFGWSEKTEVQTKLSEEMGSEELDMYIRRALKKADKTLKS